jgi:hypothetical protein
MAILSSEVEKLEGSCGDFLEEPKKIAENVSQSSGYPALDFNLSPPEYIGILIIHQVSNSLYIQ